MQLPDFTERRGAATEGAELGAGAGAGAGTGAGAGAGTGAGAATFATLK